MSEAIAVTSAFHVLLIGNEGYQEPANLLRGCANDIKALEALLREASVAGLIDDELRITAWSPQRG